MTIATRTTIISFSKEKEKVGAHQDINSDVGEAHMAVCVLEDVLGVRVGSGMRGPKEVGKNASGG